SGLIEKPKLLRRVSAEERPCSSAGWTCGNTEKFLRSLRGGRGRGLKIVRELAQKSQFCKRHRHPLPAPPDGSWSYTFRLPLGFGLFLMRGGVCLAPNDNRDTSAVCKIPCHPLFASPSSWRPCGSLAASRSRPTAWSRGGRTTAQLMPGSSPSIRCRRLPS